MKLQKINLVDVSFASDTGCYEAEFCLVLEGAGGELTRTYMRGRTQRQPDDHHDCLAARLYADMCRQLRWLPDFRNIREELQGREAPLAA